MALWPASQNSVSRSSWMKQMSYASLSCATTGTEDNARVATAASPIAPLRFRMVVQTPPISDVDGY